MHHRIPLVAAFALGLMSQSAALAQSTGNPWVGRDFALQVCAPCHTVVPTQSSPKRSSKAPDFKAIANTKGMTETSLHVFLSSPHPSMPNLILSQREQDDVIAYILGLRGPP